MWGPKTWVGESYPNLFGNVSFLITRIYDSVIVHIVFCLFGIIVVHIDLLKINFTFAIENWSSRISTPDKNKRTKYTVHNHKRYVLT